LGIRGTFKVLDLRILANNPYFIVWRLFLQSLPFYGHIHNRHLSTKGKDPVPAPFVLFNDLLMLLQSIPGDVFEVLTDEVVHTWAVKG
jgi:hypothetical protein